MIKASYLQKQGAKYRELARDEVSLEMRRQLFALAARCDELAAMMTRWPGPKEIAAQAHKKPPSKKPHPAEAPRDGERTSRRFADGAPARLVHGFAD